MTQPNAVLVRLMVAQLKEDAETMRMQTEQIEALKAEIERLTRQNVELRHEWGKMKLRNSCRRAAS